MEALTYKMDKTHEANYLEGLEYHEYGVTVNIQPTQKMNKRLWKHYSYDQQRQQLVRIEAAFRRLHPHVSLMNLHFEIAPSLFQIHFHALYFMPEIAVEQMQIYWKKWSSTNEKTLIPWRHLHIMRIKNGNKEWLQYIAKDCLKL
jgi:hypothetical protein